MHSYLRNDALVLQVVRLAGNRKTPRSGKLAQPPEMQGATRLEAEVGMQLSACRKSETIPRSGSLAQPPET
jgi:hypothetical protein